MAEETKTQGSEQLPPGWTKRFTKDGRAFYQNNITKQTQWNPPQVHQNEGGEVLPPYAPWGNPMAQQPQIQPVQQIQQQVITVPVKKKRYSLKVTCSGFNDLIVCTNDESAAVKIGQWYKSITGKQVKQASASYYPRKVFT